MGEEMWSQFELPINLASTLVPGEELWSQLGLTMKQKPLIWTKE